MTKYIRTKDRIYEIEDEIAVTPYLDEGWKKVFKIIGSNKCIKEHEILKQADTIEELMQDNDMIYIYDLYPDTVLVVDGKIKPFGYNEKITLKQWLKYKHTEFDLYIKQSNGDYHKVAGKKQYGKLELI